MIITQTHIDPHRQGCQDERQDEDADPPDGFHPQLEPRTDQLFDCLPTALPVGQYQGSEQGSVGTDHHPGHIGDGQMYDFERAQHAEEPEKPAKNKRQDEEQKGERPR